MNAGMSVLPASFDARNLRAPKLRIHRPGRSGCGRTEIGCRTPRLAIVSASSSSHSGSNSVLGSRGPTASHIRLRRSSISTVPKSFPDIARKTKGSVGANLLTLVFTGAAGRNRTHDPLVRSQVLYPAELQPPSYTV